MVSVIGDSEHIIDLKVPRGWELDLEIKRTNDWDLEVSDGDPILMLPPPWSSTWILNIVKEVIKILGLCFRDVRGQSWAFVQRNRDVQKSKPEESPEVLCWQKQF